MPDSEHPSGDDSRDVTRRSSDESTPVERRSRTSTAARPTRPTRTRSTSTDPRKEGARTPPRRPKPRSVVETIDDDVDVAAALARVPDANGDTPEPVADTVEESTVEARTVEDAPVEEQVVEADTDVEAPEVVEDEVSARDSVDEVVEDAAPDTELLPVVEPEPELQDTELLTIVDDPVETEILPVIDPEIDSPRIYDVEEDEPGAYVTLVPALTEPVASPAVVEPPVDAPPKVVVRRRRRPRVRRVTRVIRHVDTWTVFKVALLFNVVLYATTLISGVLLWNVAHGTGTVDNVERFMESFGWETFQFNGQELFDNGWRLGLFMALGLTGLAVLAATTFNLITDIVGGIRVTVLEEEVIVAPPSVARRTNES